MRLDMPEKRKAVVLAIDGIHKLRQKGDLAVKRWEIMKNLEIEYTDLDQAIRWLASKGIIERDGDSAGWKIALKINPKTFCWLHGHELPCKSCKRSKYRGGKANG